MGCDRQGSGDGSAGGGSNDGKGQRKAGGVAKAGDGERVRCEKSAGERKYLAGEKTLRAKRCGGA